MALDEERLFVTLEARVTEFERRMKSAEKRGTDSFQKLQRGSATATRQMEQDMVRSTGRINQALASTSGQIGKFSSAFSGLRAGPVAAGLTAAAAAILSIGKAAHDSAESIARIGDEAQRAGVSAEAFQKWAFVAEQNRVPVDSLIDGLKELNLRADEFVTTGGGSAAAAFQRLGYSAEELRDKLKDPSELMLEIIGRLQKLDRAAQIRIADEVFGGTGGERFVELIDEGEAGIRRTMQRAEDLGVVLDDDLIAKAAELDRWFNTMTTTVGVHLRAAIVSAFEALGAFMDRFRDVQDQSASTLQTGIDGALRRHAELQERLATLQSGDGLSDTARGLGFGPDSAATRREIEQINGEMGELSGYLDQATARMRELNAERQTYAATSDEVTLPEITVDADQPPATPSSSSRGGGRGSRERATDLEREIEAILRRTEAIRAGTAAQAGINPLLDEYGYAAECAATETSLLLAAQQAGIQITPGLKSQIAALADGYAQASAEAAKLDEAQADAVQRAEDMKSLGQDVTGGFIKGLRDGASAADLLTDALGRVADRLLDMALNAAFSSFGSGGGLGSLFGAGLGSLFGFVSGGFTGTGGKYEPAGVVHRGEYVFSKAAVERLGVGRLESLHRAAKRGSYAEGGPVAASPAAAQPNIKIVNSIDPTDIVNSALATEAGQRVILNFFSQNQQRVSAALRV